MSIHQTAPGRSSSLRRSVPGMKKYGLLSIWGEKPTPSSGLLARDEPRGCQNPPGRGDPWLPGLEMAQILSVLPAESFADILHGAVSAQNHSLPFRTFKAISVAGGNESNGRTGTNFL